MNISKTKFLLVALTLSCASLASAGNGKAYIAQDTSIESKICVAAASASRMRMNAAVDQLLPTKMISIQYKLIANKLSCNGINVADFALQAGNIDLANKLKSYRTKNVDIRDIANTYSGNVTIIGA